MLFHKHVICTIVPSSCASSARKLLITRVRDLCNTTNNNLIFKSFKSTKTTGHHDNTNEICRILAKILDISEVESRRIVEKAPKILACKEDGIVQTVNALKKYGLLEVVKTTHPRVLALGSVPFENYRLIIKETGITTLPHNPNFDSRYHYYKSKTIHKLKPNPIPSNFDVVQSYIKVLGLNEEHANELYRYLPSDPDSLPLESLRMRVLEYYFSVAWNCSISDSENIVSRNRDIRNRSFTWTRKITEILQRDFDYDTARLLSDSSILQRNPEKLQELCTKVKTLGNIPLKEMVKKDAQILSTNPENLLEIESLFTNSGYPSRSLSNFPNIFCLDPETVKARLLEIKADPGLQHCLNHDRIPTVVYYLSRFKKRLSSLRETNGEESYFSIDRLCANSNHYNKRFSDVGAAYRYGTDSVTILSRFFCDKTKSEIKNQLDSSNPYWRIVPSNNISDILNYIIKFKVISKDCVFESLAIVLYPLESVRESFKVTIESGNSKMEDFNFLPQVLYFLEKNYHFAGPVVGNHAEVQKTNGLLVAEK